MGGQDWLADKLERWSTDLRRGEKVWVYMKLGKFVGLYGSNRRGSDSLWKAAQQR